MRGLMKSRRASVRRGKGALKKIKIKKKTLKKKKHEIAKRTSPAGRMEGACVLFTRGKYNNTSTIILKLANGWNDL